MCCVFEREALGRHGAAILRRPSKNPGSKNGKKKQVIRRKEPHPLPLHSLGGVYPPSVNPQLQAVQVQWLQLLAEHFVHLPKLGGAAPQWGLATLKGVGQAPPMGPLPSRAQPSRPPQPMPTAHTPTLAPHSGAGPRVISQVSVHDRGGRKAVQAHGGWARGALCTGRVAVRTTP